MKKKLRIKFWKAEEALVMQIIEQKGLPVRKEEGAIHIINCPALRVDNISLRGNQHLDDLNLNYMYFANNSERDDYLDKITQAITDELFTNVQGELKIGELCEVRSYDNDEWGKRELLAVLPPKFSRRYIVRMWSCFDEWESYMQARPIAKRIEPKIEVNGEITVCTWEEE